MYRSCLICMVFIALGCGPTYGPREDKDSTASVYTGDVLTDRHDLFSTGKDSALVKAVVDAIFADVEVEEFNNLLLEMTKGKHGAAILATDVWNNDASYFLFEVGDNSRDDRFVPYFNFIFHRLDRKLYILETMSDSLVFLKSIPFSK